SVDEVPAGSARLRVDSCRGHRSIRWWKDRHPEHRLDPAPIPHSDLVNERLHERLALWNGTGPKGEPDLLRSSLDPRSVVGDLSLQGRGDRGRGGVTRSSS